jgi:hypothetical protein
MTQSLALPYAPRNQTVREAAVAQVVPLLRVSLEPAALGASRIEDSPAGRIITGVLYRDADTGTFDGTAHLAAGVLLVLSWLVPALAARTDVGDPRDLARGLADACRSGRGGEHVADVLDHLLDGSVGAGVLGRLLADDQEALLATVLGLAEVGALQARALARSDRTDLEVVWDQIEEGLREHR